MNLANIIKLSNKNRYIVYPINNTIDAGGVASEPYVFLDETISYLELAKEVLKALDESKLNVECPNDWKEFRKNYLKSMEIKTMKELHKNSISLGVLKRDGILKFSPTKNMGSRQGFQYSKSLSSVELPEDSSIEKIAEALKEALSRCEY